MAEFGERRLIPVTLDQVPNLFVRAVLDTEDKRFYEHRGVDLITLTTAAMELVLNRGEITRGGSTITMQLPRNLGTFSLDRLFIRKFKEILLALKIERELSKDEILELYINAVPFGKRAYGAQAAAFTYYGKPLPELSLAELAMLAGIPQAPTAGNPVNDVDRALNRRNVVLSRMLEQRSITREQYDQAIAAPNTARLHERELDVPAPYPAEWVRAELLPQIPDLYSGGYEVITTLDAKLQRAANVAVRNGLFSYDRRHGYRGPEAVHPDGDREAWLDVLQQTPVYRELLPAIVTEVGPESARALLWNGSDIELTMDGMAWARRYLTVDSRGPAPSRPADVLAVGDLIRVREQTASSDADAAAASGWVLTQVPEIQGALVSLDHHSGAVRALVGGLDFSLNQYNHALQAARQPGSGFKPFVYAAALAEGIMPSSIFMDAPLVFEDRNLESEYRPDNDNSRYNGPTRLREALYRSINLVTMRVLLRVGAGKVIDFSERFGFDTSTFPRDTQLAVGGGTMAITPLQMAVAYATFANGGHRIEPHIIDEVVDLAGERVLKPRHPVVCNDCANPTREAGAPTANGPDAEPATLDALLSGAEPGLAEPGQAEPGQAEPDPQGPVPAPRVLDERIAFIMHSMLQDVVRRGTAVRARALERSDLAGKTGTTNEAADTWFNGYNGDLASTVWVGFPSHQPLGSREYASTTPLPIWIDYMRTAAAGRPERTPTQPAGIVTVRIDPASGEAAMASDPDAVFEYFLAEHTPRAPRTGSGDTGARRPDEVAPVDIF
ncbi:MAG: PBP1A family penicillin-binding protein [Pseudomonadales bacterium]